MSCESRIMIVGACVLIIPGADETARYKDLINSVLLAQLVANKKLEKNPDVDWYGAYVEFLDGYWLRYTRARQQWTITQDSIESVSDWVIGSMPQVTTDKDTALGTALQRMARLSGAEPAMQALRNHMQKIAVDVPGNAPEPAMTVRLLVIAAQSPISTSSVYIELKTDKIISANPLAQVHRSEDVRGVVSLRYAGTKLSETLYGHVRDAIALKVRDRYEGNVVVLMLDDDAQATQTCAAD